LLTRRSCRSLTPHRTLLTVPELTERLPSPVAPEERLLTLDVLRGVAMFGVILSNFNDSYGAFGTERSPSDAVFFWIQAWLVQNRFYTLLAFLFGVGFAIQMLRAEERGRNIRTVYVRRVAALLLIGLIHGVFIWDGDILATYALAGAALLLFRKLSTRQLLLAVVAVEVLARYVISLLLRAFGATPPGPVYSIADPGAIYAHGDYSQILQLQFQKTVNTLAALPFGQYWFVLALMLVGLAVGRSGILRNLPERRRVIYRTLLIAVVCLPIGLYFAARLPQWWSPLTRWPLSIHDPNFWHPRFALIFVPNFLTQWSQAAIYACLVTLYVLRQPQARINRWLAAVGRMALTTYLTQSVVGVLIFYGYGLALYGKVPYTPMFFLAVTIFALQIVASTWWLQRFQFGPVEWLWRSLTYGRRMPFRRTG
jgi:uncharacterized protein